MRRFIYLAMALLVLPRAGAAATENIDQVRKSLVRIHVVSQQPDYKVPWNPGKIATGTGTGFLIEGQRILTNAHVSSNARFITVEKEGDSRRYEARVKFIAHDCDLALLEVLDPRFYEGMHSLPLGGVPALDSTVTVIGFPIGGERLSVTRGVVSRIDFQLYSHSSVDGHLAIQIDAAINPGNSGGPVLQDHAVVGVAFQALNRFMAQNVGYMIPVPVVQRFLTDIADGSYDHYVDLGVYQFPLRNPTFRRAIGLGPGDYGVYVADVIRASATSAVLQPGDVLLAIDGLPIFSDGHVQMDGERVLLNEVVERKFAGDTVRLDLIRSDQMQTVDVPLNSPWPYLMQARRHDVRPRFYIFGGLVFQPLSGDFVRANKVRDVTLLYHYSQFLQKNLYLDRPEVVVLTKILPDPVNSYFTDYRLRVVDEVNGRRIRSLEDLAAAFDAPHDPHIIRLLGAGRPLVMEAEAVAACHRRLKEAYGINQMRYLKDSIVPDHWLAERSRP